MRSARQTVEQLLRATTSGEPGTIADCYAPEVVIEMPFAVDALYPSRIQTTRESLRARFEAGSSVRRYTSVTDAIIRETDDPEVIVAEYTLHGEMTETGDPFTARFAMVITVRDGHIVHSRDYTDPIAGARLLGKLPELVAALSG
jgi:ketosteroid isomerase-like protein